MIFFTFPFGKKAGAPAQPPSAGGKQATSQGAALPSGGAPSGASPPPSAGAGQSNANDNYSQNARAAPSPLLRPQPQGKYPPPEVMAKEIAALRHELDDTVLQLEICKIIIDRYRKFIEDGEAKSIAELRGLVRPLDHAVVEMKINIQDAFHPYVYEKHFLPAVQKSLDLIFSFRTVSLPVNFWLEFEEIPRLNASDDIDRAILLCSLLRGLGSESAKVMITKSKEALVTFDFGEKQYLVEISRKAMSAYQKNDEQFNQVRHSAIYTFNDRDYEDLSEG